MSIIGFFLNKYRISEWCAQQGTHNHITSGHAKKQIWAPKNTTSRHDIVPGWMLYPVAVSGCCHRILCLMFVGDEYFCLKFHNRYT